MQKLSGNFLQYTREYNKSHTSRQSSIVIIFAVANRSCGVLIYVVFRDARRWTHHARAVSFASAGKESAKITRDAYLHLKISQKRKLVWTNPINWERYRYGRLFTLLHETRTNIVKNDSIISECLWARLISSRLHCVLNSLVFHAFITRVFIGRNIKILIADCCNHWDKDENYKIWIEISCLRVTRLVTHSERNSAQNRESNA